MKRFLKSVWTTTQKGYFIPVALCVMTATLSVLSGCAKKKAATASPAAAAPTPPTPTPVAPPPPPPVNAAFAPGPNDDIAYEDMTWLQSYLDPAATTYQAILTAKRPTSYDTHPGYRDDDSYDDENGRDRYHDADADNKDGERDERFRKSTSNYGSGGHDDHYHNSEMVSQDATITIGKTSVGARQTQMGWNTQPVQNAYYLHFYSNGPLGQIKFSKFLERHWEYEGVIPYYGRQTRFSLRSHMVSIPELSDNYRDEDTSFKVELQFALRQGNSVDPAQTRISILGCVPNSSGYKRCRSLPSVKLKLRGGKR